MSHKQFYVYILASYTQRLYIGLTSDLERRLWEHRTKALPGHTSKYNIDRLVRVEEFVHAGDAIARERQLKNWSRQKKIALIVRDNPTWKDLAMDLFDWSENEFRM
jgi:putative endonuclease